MLRVAGSTPVTSTIFILVLIVTFSFLISGCTYLFYHPERRPLIDPHTINFYPESHYVKYENHNIHTWVFPSKKKHSGGVIVFFHGNAQNVTTHFLNLSWIPEDGYDFVIFDYPGYGMSDGKPSPKSTVDSSIAVLKWVIEKYPSKPLIIYGQSLGGIIALKTLETLRNEIKIQSLVLDSTFYSYDSVAKSVLQKSWITWIFQPLTYLLIDNSQSPKNFDYLSSVPKLVIHSKQDPVVNFNLGEKLYNKLPEPKTFWSIESKTHGDVFAIYNLKYRKDFLDFLSRTQK